MSKNHVNKFKNLTIYIPPLTLLFLTALTTLSLHALPTSADPNRIVSSVTVEPSCSFTGVEDPEHPHQAIKMLNGQHFTGDETGYTTLSTYCNDANGYNIYAQGCTIEDEDGNCATTGENTRMIDEDNTNTETNYIATGVYPDVLLASTPSSWAMALIPGASGQEPNIAEDYKDNKYNVIPTTSTLVASYPATTTGKYKTSSTLTTNYEIYISQTQPSGTYIGKVKYTMVTVPAILAQTYIQDLTLDQCKVNVGTNGNSANIGDNITVADLRDGNLYTVRYINGYCWMTQNLRFVGDAKTSTMTLSPTTSNVKEERTFTYYDLATNASSSDELCYGDGKGNGNGYTMACIHAGGNGTVWYNYPAASASTISGASNTDPMLSDICPIGWHIPSGPAYAASSQWYVLFQENAVNNEQVPVNDYFKSFGPSTSGFYSSGTISMPQYGFWWSSTHAPTFWRNTMTYVAELDATSEEKMYSGNNQPYNGVPIRCVRTS